jgi:hypothetical protein
VQGRRSGHGDDRREGARKTWWEERRLESEY